MLDVPLQLVTVSSCLSIVLELAAIAFRSTVFKRACYLSVIMFAVFASMVLVVYDPGLAAFLLVFVTIFRVFNAMRVIQARTTRSRLYPVSRRTSLHLVLLSAVILLAWLVGVLRTDISPTFLIYILAVASLGVSIILLVSVWRNLKKTAWRASDAYRPDADLPSVSICIPARNETQDLSASLDSVLKLAYPKLEVLVLDDCSQDRTSEIIKGFARDGVRFIAGEAPNKGWLAKNQAYQALAEAASGEILVFCGVDVRLKKGSLQALIGSMFARKKQMISVLPHGLQQREDAAFIQPMRYWWELALPRRLFNRPPVLSTTWAITRQAFFGLGGIKAVKSSVLPEGYFARELAKNDEYSFMRAGGSLAISSTKRLPEQWETAVRLRYPQLRKRPENVLYIVGAQLWFLAMPVALFVAGFFVDMGYLWIITGLNACLLLYAHFAIVRAWNSAHASLAVALFPLSIGMEIVVQLVSMWKYEFSKVTWKGRNICIPVMRVIPRLPKT